MTHSEWNACDGPARMHEMRRRAMLGPPLSTSRKGGAMLVLYVHFAPRDNTVHVDRGRYVVRALGAEGGAALLLLGEASAPAPARLARGQSAAAGPATVRVLAVTPAGVRLGFDAPPEVRIERDKLVRRRRRR